MLYARTHLKNLTKEKNTYFNKFNEMTLIYGIHTQVGVYLAADLRLTFTNTSTGEKRFEDDFCKYMTIGKHMHLVAAGDANLASFLVRKMLASDLVDLPFVEFKEKISGYIKSETGLYPLIQDPKTKSVVFIFAGTDPTKKEVMSMDKMIEKIQIMQGESNASVPATLFKPLRDAMYKASVEQKSGMDLEIDKPLVSLFALEVRPSSSGITTKLTEGEWGVYIMYGPNGLRTENAPPELAIKLDLAGRPKGETAEDMIHRHSLELIKFFRKSITDLQLETVGGSILTLWITEHGASVIAGDTIAFDRTNGKVAFTNCITEKDGKICTKIDGKITPMRSLLNIGSPNEKTSLDI